MSAPIKLIGSKPVTFETLEDGVREMDMGNGKWYS